MAGSSNFYQLILTVLSVVAIGQATDKTFRMCVPQQYYDYCTALMEQPRQVDLQLQCLAARDRMECVDMLNRNEADVMTAEPEDMYVASLINNDNFKVISEIRTEADKHADFRYEGIILVRKNSSIHSLNDLRGKRSCHTGYGRNVGYKIPITKLKNLNILKISMNPEITATERELMALSEFFTQSCLVGTYSSHEDVDRLLKKKYSNLCALCEHPDICNYPDKFSGYDGAIRCLDQGNGDVAFTKVQYIKKYFGLLPDVEAEGNPSDFEYLCEDGSRLPVTGPACSWAQRPWIGYLTNSAITSNPENLQQLQEHLKTFFDNAIQEQNKAAASAMLINPMSTFHNKNQATSPREYLEIASYKDVIERDGSSVRKMRFCVESEIEMKKCMTMSRACYSRDIRPEIECVQETNCIAAVSGENADLVAVKADHYKHARSQDLMPIAYEGYEDNNVYVAIVNPGISNKDLNAMPIHYDESNARARSAAAYLNRLRNMPTMQAASTDETAIVIANSNDLWRYKDKQLLCPDMEKKSLTEWPECNMEAHLPLGIFIRSTMTATEQDTIKHLFTSVSTAFGTHSKRADIFKLFGEFMPHHKNVIFNDDSSKFVLTLNNENVKEEIYNSLFAKKSN